MRLTMDDRAIDALWRQAPSVWSVVDAYAGWCTSSM
jgi:hypothetical protein